MALLTSKKLAALSATDPDLAAASVGGDEFQNGRVVLMVQNSDASPHTVTITSFYEATPGTSADDIEIVVPAGETRLIPGFGQPYLADEQGLVQLAYDAVTGLQVAVFSV